MSAGLRSLALCAATALSAAGALAADGGADARARYQQERAACAGISAADERRTCLREAGAALAEAKRDGLIAPSSAEANLTARCDVHKAAADREDCLRRMRGEGKVSGSVEGGGIYRELTTIIPGN